MSPEERESAADAARDTAVRTAVGMAVQIAVLVGFSLAVSHQQAIRARAGQLAARARRRRPAASELDIAEFGARVSAYSHGEAP